MKASRLTVSTALILLASSPVLKAADVWLDFTDFQAQLNGATTSAGVANFTPAETATIEANILADFQSIYSAYTLTFFTGADPGGTRERVNFGAVSGSPGSLGSAPLDFGNVSVGTQSVFSANFGSYIESFEPRAQQISEISTSLAGTGALPCSSSSR